LTDTRTTDGGHLDQNAMDLRIAAPLVIKRRILPCAALPCPPVVMEWSRLLLRSVMMGTRITRMSASTLVLLG